MNLSDFYTHLLGLPSSWQITEVIVEESSKSVHLYLEHAAKSKFACPSCDALVSVYDHCKERCWRHLDTCDHQTHLHACLPRVKCLNCGIHTIKAPWADGRSSFTLQFECYIIDILEQTQVLSRSALLLDISVDQVRYIRDKAVKRGMARSQSHAHYKVAHLCIDEKSLFKGHHYVTIFYDGANGAVLEVVEHRTIEATNLGFNHLDKYIDLAAVEVVTMDMWDAFKTACEQKLPNVPIVHDRFHIAQHINKAVDIVRRAENKRLVKQGDERLKKTKYLWLKNPANLKESSRTRLKELVVDQDLKTVIAYQLKEDFKSFFDCKDQKQATTFFQNWQQQVEQTQLAPLLKVAKMIKSHLDRLLTYFDNRVTNAMAECKNSLIQQIKFKARGFKSAKAFRNAILFFCGDLDLYP